MIAPNQIVPQRWGEGTHCNLPKQRLKQSFAPSACCCTRTCCGYDRITASTCQANLRQASNDHQGLPLQAAALANKPALALNEAKELLDESLLRPKKTRLELNQHKQAPIEHSLELNDR